MRRLALTIAAVAAAVVTSTAGAATDRSVEVTLAGRTPFPERALVVSLPTGARLGPDEVRVLENGIEATELTVTPVGAAMSGGAAVVLVIDASNSMRGKPIADALVAARAFVERRSENHPLAIITFNDGAQVLLPFTKDQDRIESTLAGGVELREGTYLYDGVRQALASIKTAGLWPASIVLLSDGRDTGSSATLAAIRREAREAHVRVFAVGLQSRQYDGDALRSLAIATRGTYVEATSSEQLETIFDALGAKLSSEYLVRYRSTAGPSRTVEVAVEIEGLPGVAVTGYRTPALARSFVPPHQKSLVGQFWLSPLSMLLVSLIGALAAACLTLLALARPGRPLTSRLAEFVSILSAEDPAAARSSLTRAFFDSAERPFSRAVWWSRFSEELEIARIRMPPVQVVLWTVVGTVASAWILALVGGSKVSALPALGIPLAVRGAIKFRLRRQRNQFAEQLPENLQVLASALRAGHSFVGALSVVVDESDEPSRREFRRVVADEQLGVPLDEALLVVVRRMDNRDLEQVALVAALQREAGGNSAEVLDRVTETVRGRFEVRRLVQTLTAQGRLSRWILSLLPGGLLAVITLLNPNYTEPLYKTTAGQLMLALGGIMVVAGSLAIKKIINIKV